jgi:hypothetical protein
MKPKNPCENCVVRPTCNIPEKRSIFTPSDCMDYENYMDDTEIYKRQMRHKHPTDDDDFWLLNGIFFKEDIRLSNESFVEFVYNKEFCNKKFRRLKLYKEALSCVIGNLVIASKDNVPVSKPSFKSNKFKFKWFNKTIIENILDVLYQEGYCIYWDGYYIDYHNARSRRYAFTYDLIKTKFETEVTRPEAYIQLNKIDPRDRRKISRSQKRKIYITPPPCKKLTEMTRDIEYINNFLSNATVKFTYDNEIYKRDKYQTQLESLCKCNYLFCNNNEYEINKESLYLFRIFNRGGDRYKYGGRFYTKVFQGIPSDVRPNITLNGIPTVELDFSAHHLRILYHIEKVDFRGEIYIYNKEDKENEDNRMVHKKIAMIAINAENKKSAINAVRKALKEEKKVGKFKSDIPPIKEIERLYNEFIEHHKPIAKYVGADKGIELQRIDSDIMNKILVELTDLKILALPVHDSIIVQVQHEEKLKELMIKYYKQLLNFNPIITK